MNKPPHWAQVLENTIFEAINDQQILNLEDFLGKLISKITSK